ncbi:hypothetical protein F5148DRAFT_903461 [Russula earlei]|uniref:Uncharacterized protein n=1 Tax=Russula earlei TaxID=71964 RepID=A0ACC0UL35_9AGAM|nr:hypothetical protein F5148DRAFT_903461 [Russula earlei]
MGQFTSIDWQECSLPDGTRYYVNPTLHTITDVDLRNTERLDAVTRFLDRCDMEDVPPPEWELWLRDSSESRTVFIPHRAWVHHGLRILVFERPGSHPGISKDVDSTLRKHTCVYTAWIDNCTEIESEYHYWLFMGSHPLHAPLPSKSVAEAIDVLTWFYTSLLLCSFCYHSFTLCQTHCYCLRTIPHPRLLRRNVRNCCGNFVLLAVSLIAVISDLLTYVSHRHVYAQVVT